MVNPKLGFGLVFMLIVVPVKVTWGPLENPSITTQYVSRESYNQTESTLFKKAENGQFVYEIVP